MKTKTDPMDTMNIALPESMKSFVSQQVGAGGYASASEYIRSLIRADQRRRLEEQFETEVLKGIRSGEPTPMTKADWESLRQQVLQQQVSQQRPTSDS